ncbi:MAG: flavodoxin domain-containing protein [Candidatus Hadarchaeum sp.]|uniref:flavodoxin family protein n=1 Tax=Candidatus Hadarchaeum sp. TaxID=2883567 RepID=UPI00317A593E
MLIAYESKYGNTKLVAEKIAEGTKKVKGVKPQLAEIKEVNLDVLHEYDVIFIGSPNHIGGPTRGVRKFVDELGRRGLGGKTFVAFDTYLGGDFGKAVKKLERRIIEKIPGAKVLAPGLSVKVQGMKGPVSEEELTKVVEFGRMVAAKIK